MPRSELVIILGVCLSLTGGGLTIALAVARWREFKLGRRTPRLENLLELAAPALVFGGVAVVQLADQALHAAQPLARQGAALSILGPASGVFVFGVLLGRVITRWQLRQLHGLVDGETGAIHTRA